MTAIGVSVRRTWPILTSRHLYTVAARASEICEVVRLVRLTHSRRRMHRLTFFSLQRRYTLVRVLVDGMPEDIEELVFIRVSVRDRRHVVLQVAAAMFKWRSVLGKRRHRRRHVEGAEAVDAELGN